MPVRALQLGSRAQLLMWEQRPDIFVRQLFGGRRRTAGRDEAAAGVPDDAADGDARAAKGPGKTCLLAWLRLELPRHPAAPEHPGDLDLGRQPAGRSLGRRWPSGEINPELLKSRSSSGRPSASSLGKRRRPGGCRARSWSKIRRSGRARQHAGRRALGLRAVPDRRRAARSRRRSRRPPRAGLSSERAGGAHRPGRQHEQASKARCTTRA